jgi:hypothetical protein
MLFLFSSYNHYSESRSLSNSKCYCLLFFVASTTAIRTGKPFNPLLGETYECDRYEYFYIIWEHQQELELIPYFFIQQFSSSS